MKRMRKVLGRTVSAGEVTIESRLRLSQKEAAMLNPKEVISQAKDKQKENLEWIEMEAELRQALGTGKPRRKMPRKRGSRGVMEFVKSLILLMKPEVGQKADR
jgi:hypothetical protein